MLQTTQSHVRVSLVTLTFNGSGFGLVLFMFMLAFAMASVLWIVASLAVIWTYNVFAANHVPYDFSHIVAIAIILAVVHGLLSNPNKK